MSICEEAKAIIGGERQDQYGAPEDSFQTIAVLWDVYIEARSGVITSADVAKMMILMKLARTVHGKDKRDNYVDMVGYTLIAARMAGFEP